MSIFQTVLSVLMEQSYLLHKFYALYVFFPRTALNHPLTATSQYRSKNKSFCLLIIVLGIVQVRKSFMLLYVDFLYLYLFSSDYLQLVFAIIGILASSLQMRIGGLTVQSGTTYVTKQITSGLSLNFLFVQNFRGSSSTNRHTFDGCYCFCCIEMEHHVPID
jgi:hypothetical protein